jgi:hypothetical protein
MRRPINWVVVLISICVLFVGTTLPGCGEARADSASGDNGAAEDLFGLVSDSAELDALLRTARAEGGEPYIVEPAVLTFRDDAPLMNECEDDVALATHAAF